MNLWPIAAFICYVFATFNTFNGRSIVAVLWVIAGLQCCQLASGVWQRWYGGK